MSYLVWQTVQRKVADLVPQKVNPRKISPIQMRDLKKSLEKYNVVEIPAIDFDGKILAGHQRVQALKILGRSEEVIDVRIPNRKLSEEEAKGYLIGSNALGGDWDFSLLKENFTPEVLADIGFDADILANIWDDNLDLKGEDFNVEEELKKIKKPKTKLGDLILLDKHKLICGSSNDPEVIKKLFGEEKTSFIYQDPIYNLKIKYSSGLGGKQNYGGNVNDDRTDEEYREFLKKNMQVSLSVANPDCHIFYWNTEQQIGLIQDLYRELGITMYFPHFFRH